MMKKYLKFARLNTIKKKRSGSTIIELLISLMIVGLVVTAIAATGTYSIKNSGEARFKQVATTLGQEVIEKSRAEKNRLGFINFNNAVGENIYCFDTIPNDFTSDLPLSGVCGTDDVVNLAGTDFIREASFSSVDALTTEVEVNVLWNDSGNERSIQLIYQLTKPFQDS